jgi:hypothetical protein
MELSSSVTSCTREPTGKDLFAVEGSHSLITCVGFEKRPFTLDLTIKRVHLFVHGVDHYVFEVDLKGNFVKLNYYIKPGEQLTLPDNLLTRLTLEYLVLEDDELKKRSGFQSAWQFRQQLIDSLCGLAQ